MKNLLIAALALMMAACNRSDGTCDSSLLSSVPAGSRAVVVADLYACAEEAGLRISSDGFIGSGKDASELSLLPRRFSAPLMALASRRHMVDLSHVAVFADSATGSVIFTAMRIEGTDLPDEPEDSPAAFFADDSRVWAVAKPFTRDDLNSVLLSASRHSLAEVEDDAEFLSSYRPARAILRPEPFRNEAGDDFSTVYIASRTDENTLTLRITYADSLGKEADPFSRLSPVDENVYSYLPQATAATIAIGSDRHTFRTILSNYGGFMPLRQRMAAELSSGFLCDSASTTAVGFAPGGSAETISDFSLGTWVFTALLPIEIDRTEDFIDIIDKLTQGSLQCDIAGPYLAVSNSSLEGVASGDDYGTNPSSSVFTVQAVIPYRSEQMKALRIDRGLSLDAQCSKGATVVRISTLGGDEPPGQVIVSLLRNFPAKKQFLFK